MLEIVEALHNGSLRLNDPNFLVDDSRIYHVDTVLLALTVPATSTTGTRKITLADAVVKGLVDKKRCTVKYAGTEYSVREAMQRGFVEGRILTSFEIKWLLDEAARRVVNRLASSKSLDRLDEREDSPASQPPQPPPRTVSTNKLLGVPLESFNEFFIFDPDSERYVPISKAFYTGFFLFIYFIRPKLSFIKICL